VTVSLLLRLDINGSLRAPPEVTERPNGPYADVAADAARRAVIDCQPYALPPEKYDAWDDMTIVFTPTALFF
jgi:hypothetical protein